MFLPTALVHRCRAELMPAYPRYFSVLVAIAKIQTFREVEGRQPANLSPYVNAARLGGQWQNSGVRAAMLSRIVVDTDAHSVLRAAIEQKLNRLAEAVPEDLVAQRGQFPA